MRILEFEVEKQRVKKKPTCDFSGLVAGSIGYLYAKFNIKDSDWRNCSDIIARFWVGDKENEKEYAKRLDSNGQCEIPPEVLTEAKFGVSVLGVSTTYQIKTGKVYVRQEVH